MSPKFVSYAIRGDAKKASEHAKGDRERFWDTWMYAPRVGRPFLDEIIVEAMGQDVQDYIDEIEDDF
jgi:hypothetical protein